MRRHSREEFQTWLAKDEEVRDELERMVGAEFGIDESSLDSLEAFLLARYRHPDEALQLNERGVLDAAARHITDVSRLREHRIVYAPIAGHPPGLHGIGMNGALGFFRLFFADAPVFKHLRARRLNFT